MARVSRSTRTWATVGPSIDARLGSIAPLAVGAEARRVFEAGRLFYRANYPPVRWLLYPGFREAATVLATLMLLALIGPMARRASGRSLGAQLADLLVLGLRDRFDPLSYYLQDLHRAGGRAEAASYLTRGETKNGLMRAFSQARLPIPAQNAMNNKLLFDSSCRRLGLPVPQLLLSIDAGAVTWHAARSDLDRDLVCKPRNGRGARGLLLLRRTRPNIHADDHDEQLSLDAWIERLRQRSRKVPLLVQARLFNHADVADLAEQSLVTIRVLTCLDASDHPVATHGMLRILCKLEPWPRNDELGVPIDLKTGRLGLVASDALTRCTTRSMNHPVTRQRITGRVLASWPEAMAMAVSAHHCFRERILIGWDIALTPNGPVLLEGNPNPDVMFPQRTHGAGIGNSALGPLLQHHLGELARAHGVAPILRV